MTCQQTRGAFEHLKKLEPKTLPKKWMMIESKEVSWQQKFRSRKNEHKIKDGFGQNTKIGSQKLDEHCLT